MTWNGLDRFWTVWFILNCLKPNENILNFLDSGHFRKSLISFHSRMNFFSLMNMSIRNQVKRASCYSKTLFKGFFDLRYLSVHSSREKNHLMEFSPNEKLDDQRQSVIVMSISCSLVYSLCICNTLFGFIVHAPSTVLSFHTMVLGISAVAAFSVHKIAENEGHTRELHHRKIPFFIRNTLKAYVCLE